MKLGSISGLEVKKFMEIPQTRTRYLLNVKLHSHQDLTSAKHAQQKEFVVVVLISGGETLQFGR